MDESKDSAMEMSIIGQLEGSSYPLKLEHAIQQAFAEEKSRINVDYAKSIPPDIKAYDAYGSFEILNYGFTLIDRDSEYLSAYILIHVYALSRAGEVLWDDREKIVSRRRATIVDLQQNPGLVSELLDYVTNEAGHKIAYRIIYK